jgi:hypothetical protein
MTKQMPSFIIAGIWKHTDLPPPVGISAKYPRRLKRNQ